MSIMELLKQRVLFLDGGMGSLLQERGLKPGELPETWNLSHPEVVQQIHREYLLAGSDVVTSNTFGANRLKYPADGELETIVESGILQARVAVEACGKGYVALDLGPTGKLLKPLGDLGFEEAYQLYKEVVVTGAKAGADLILIETMSDGYEAKAAVLAAKENCSLPVFVTMAFDGSGKLLTGGTVSSTVALLEGLGVDVLGVNCGLGPVQMKEIVKEMLEVSSTPILVSPNAGLPRSEGGQTVYDIDAGTFAQVMAEMVTWGVNGVGGCCGTTPEHIWKLTECCQGLPQSLPQPKNRTVISSWAGDVIIGNQPVLIGERINPTGKPKLKQALREHNLEYLLREAVMQQERGARVLDVNVGLPGIDEPSMMEEVIRELQGVMDLPLQIDTSDISAMERAMRIYNGKPLINSVNGKQESMEEVFPLVKKYGGVVVALALDEGGIPEDSDGRIRIAKKIYRTAGEYGINANDILMDALCLTVSTDGKSALTTLETVERISREYKGKTILGVSNISFGLPKREHINAAFFTMAMQKGLSAAIINPNSEAMMNAYYSFRALSDLDAGCSDYIQIYGNQEANGISANTAATGQIPDLKESICKGLKESAKEAVLARLKEQEALTIINEEMIPALDRVGKGFEQGTLFLPQLLMSAEAAKTAFEIIRDRMSQSGRVQEKKGKIILATVKGDIHDIGKNIVKVLLENYGYEVIDLGKDVEPGLIVKTAAEQQVLLVGLSALMTTTVPGMEETIALLRETSPETKVMVGGAVLTEEYAKTIGADRYCKDAMASVSYAQSLKLH